MIFRRPPLLTLVLLGLAVAVAAPGDDDDDDASRVRAPAAGTESTASPAATPELTLRLSPARQLAAGLVVEALRPALFQPELQGFAKVLDIQPLLALRGRYREARAAAAVAAAALGLAERNLQRVTALNRAEIIPGRELAQSEAQWRSDRVREETARRGAAEIRREAEHAFGAELARLALDGEAALLADLAAHRRALLRVVLPAGAAGVGRGAPLFVGRDPERARALRAEVISAAPATDELVQGETWFCHAAGEHLRAGMRLTAWWPVAGEARRGVLLPAAAVVWHAGKPWAYRRVGADGFVRAGITGQRERADGWFVEHGFAAGEGIVVTGAEMLLSEEFRGRIPDQDDD